MAAVMLVIVGITVGVAVSKQAITKSELSDKEKELAYKWTSFKLDPDDDFYGLIVRFARLFANDVTGEFLHMNNEAGFTEYLDGLNAGAKFMAAPFGEPDREYTVYFRFTDYLFEDEEVLEVYENGKLLIPQTN